MSAQFLEPRQPGPLLGAHVGLPVPVTAPTVQDGQVVGGLGPPTLTIGGTQKKTGDVVDTDTLVSVVPRQLVSSSAPGAVTIQSTSVEGQCVTCETEVHDGKEIKIFLELVGGTKKWCSCTCNLG